MAKKAAKKVVSKPAVTKMDAPKPAAAKKIAAKPAAKKAAKLTLGEEIAITEARLKALKDKAKATTTEVVKKSPGSSAMAARPGDE